MDYSIESEIKVQIIIKEGKKEVKGGMNKTSSTNSNNNSAGGSEALSEDPTDVNYEFNKFERPRKVPEEIIKHNLSVKKPWVVKIKPSGNFNLNFTPDRLIDYQGRSRARQLD